MTADSWDISRRRRASAHSTYSGSEKTSSDTNSVSRSFAAGKIIMPRDREQHQREDLGRREAGLDGPLLLLAARHRRALRGERVDPVAVRDRVQPPLGEGERGHQGHQQDRALEEERRAVHRDRAHRRHVRLAAGVAVRRQRDDGGERGGQADDGDGQLGGVAGPARQERLDQHAQHRRAEDDQHRRQLRVLDVRCRDGGDRQGDGGRGAHLAFSFATALICGTGSVRCTSESVALTAGLTMSVTGFG